MAGRKRKESTSRDESTKGTNGNHSDTIEIKLDDDMFDDCPFSIDISCEPAQGPLPPKSGNGAGDAGQKKRRKGKTPKIIHYLQQSLFQPEGSFKTHTSLDTDYRVEPWDEWTAMNGYNSFIINKTKYCVGCYIYIANEDSMTNAQATKDDLISRPLDYWIGRVLEVRATDVENVFARVAWMYRPGDLSHSKDFDGKWVIGRQPYHGVNEVVCSNHMDVVNVSCVANIANVEHWQPKDLPKGQESQSEEENDLLNGIYWRQALDIRTGELSSLPLVCRCKKPANPDRILVECSNDNCDEWMHYECLKHDALMKVYKRLGKDRPHLENGEGSSNGLEWELDFSDDDGTTKHSDDEDADDTELFRKPRKPGPSSKKFKNSKTPYLGLFDASFIRNRSPNVWKVKDLRNGIIGGVRTWKQEVECLCCSRVIT